MEKSAKVLESLKNQIKEGVREETRLTNRLQAVVDAGDPNGTATDLALKLERVETDLAENRFQEKEETASYKENLQLIIQYERDVSEARKTADQMGMKLEKSASERELTNMRVSLHDDLNLGELAQAKDRVQAQIDGNVGATRAIKDLGAAAYADMADADLARAARANDILKRFKPVVAESVPVATVVK